jgi:transcriptional regulator with XRE-family HTH domain
VWLQSAPRVKLRPIRRRNITDNRRLADRLGKAVETITNIERGASWTSLEMLENLSRLLDERVEVFFEGYVRAKRKSQTRLQLEAELAGLLRDLDEDKLRVVRDLVRSLLPNPAKPVRAPFALVVEGMVRMAPGCP